MAALVLACAAGACAPRIEPPGPPLAKPALGPQSFVAADGMAAPVRRWLPDAGPVKAAVVALHGFNDYSNFFQGAGRYLADRGYAVYAYDQRGFGGAGTPGLWPGTEALADDLKAVAGAVRGRHPDRPLYLIGASMGASVIMVAMASHAPPPADGVVLSAPAVWGRATMPLHQRAALWIAAHTVPWFKLTAQGLNIRASDNTDLLKALGRDPLVIKRTRIDAIWGLVDLMDSALASSAELPGPALILLGANDEVIPEKPFRDAAAPLPSRRRWCAGWRRPTAMSAASRSTIRAGTCCSAISRPKPCGPTSPPGSTTPRRRCRPAPMPGRPSARPRCAERAQGEHVVEPCPWA